MKNGIDKRIEGFIWLGRAEPNEPLSAFTRLANPCYARGFGGGREPTAERRVRKSCKSRLNFKCLWLDFLTSYLSFFTCPSLLII